ncbi:GNAT family N-acetyltransferase [Cryptosporangium sp. NPDC048952]|uniref:GNAT family N-acetyltransferase n=1 Tax=Cryptosporangium sp. NPDC048952 TaxID=3363961 RepID=UPI0037105EDA
MDLTLHSHRERTIDACAVLELFAVERWWPERTPEGMARAIAGGPAVAAWSSDRVVGFARLLTDGVYRAYVEDVIVDRRFRRHGVAGAVVGALLEPLPDGVVVSLFCAPSLEPVYAGIGFSATKQTVMHRVQGLPST